ncbi:MAG: zinc ribbon domain-containing protein [Lachnospiraceae bacterium]|nr:zinc ribbon domain-containing protein [Lachnospiraceae bacterium]
MKGIIILVLILLIVIGIAGTVFYVSYKLKRLYHTFFESDNISQSAKALRAEYASTPKSISAMTSIILPQIVSDFPDFNYDEMKSRSDMVLTEYIRGVSERRVGTLKDGNAELKQQLENKVEALKAQGLYERHEKFRIHRTEITQYRKEGGRCIITFQSSVEYMHYVESEDTHSLVEGSKDYMYQTRYNVDLIYIQNRDLVEKELDNALGVNCPNCGAPLKALGAKVCEYCGTPVVEINIHAWSFSAVMEVS